MTPPSLSLFLFFLPFLLPSPTPQTTPQISLDPDDPLVQQVQQEYDVSISNAVTGIQDMINSYCIQGCDVQAPICTQTNTAVTYTVQGFNELTQGPITTELQTIKNGLPTTYNVAINGESIMASCTPVNGTKYQSVTFQYGTGT